MSPTNAIRRTALQAPTGLNTTDVDPKKDQARNRTKNIAIGVVIGLGLATAGYLGHGYFFGNTPIDVTSRLCELAFIMDSQTSGEIFNAKTLKHEPKVIHLPGTPEFNKALSDFFNSEGFKKCQTRDPYGLAKEEIERDKKRMEGIAKFCEADKTHWFCRPT